MASGLTGFAEDLVSPRLGTTQGPGAYDRLIQVMRELRDDPALLTPLATAWEGRRFETVFARPLLVLAALRFRALTTRDHPLGFELLMDAEAPDLTDRFKEALSDPELIPILRERHIQTNEPGRALAWGLPSMVLGLSHRAFSLVDLGCSAGLNLVVDRTAIDYRFGVNKVSGFDFPSPERRLGLDKNPIDVRDETESRWLEACIWPGQPERLARFRACRDLYRNPWLGDAPAPELRAHDFAVDDTAALLDALPDQPVLAFESVVRPYLDEAARTAHDEATRRFLAGSPRRLLAVLDPNDRPQSTTPMTLTVHLFRGGGHHAVRLAESGYHSSTCVIIPGAIQRLVALWNAA